MTSKPARPAPHWTLRVRNRYLLALDCVFLPLATFLAFALRLDSFDLGEYWRSAILAMLLGTGAKITAFALLGGYQRYWPFASAPELQLIVLAAALGVLGTVFFDLLAARLNDIRSMPRSVPYIDLLLTGLVLAGPRLSTRLLYGRAKRRDTKSGRRILIAGAGEAGSMVLQEIERNPQLGLQAVGFIDDAREKQGLSVRGARVLGTIDDIPSLVTPLRVRQVLVAIPTATGETMRRIVDRCAEAGIEARTLPGIFELIAGDVTVQRLRPIRIQDLLARDPILTDVTAVRELLAGKRVLVTGGGGSIGSELCRQVAACHPASLTVVGHGENSIYKAERNLRAAYPDLDLAPILADTRDLDRLTHVFADAQPEVVLHAAAHKHVPLMELNPVEAVTNNVGGTRNLVQTCQRFNVPTFVMISTDKAVNPTSTMGATKRVAEHLVQEAAQRTGCRYVAVRFGNVLGSRGSVVPLFQRQIEAGGPITVTHPDIERYFMTIPEAVQLVLQAATIGTGGEVFVLDMGEPVKIVDLARDMIRLAGLEEGHDIKIAFTGLRPGEKLYEELFLDDEHYDRTVHHKIFVSRSSVGTPERFNVPTFERSNVSTSSHLSHTVDRLLAAAHANDCDELYRLIRVLVPESDEALGTHC